MRVRLLPTYFTSRSLCFVRLTRSSLSPSAIARAVRDAGRQLVALVASDGLAFCSLSVVGAVFAMAAVAFCGCSRCCGSRAARYGTFRGAPGQRPDRAGPPS